MSLIEPDPTDLYEFWKKYFHNPSGGDPVSTEYKAMAVFHGKSGLSPDVFVNNFYFLADDNKVTAADDISTALLDFYDTPNTSQSLAARMSAFVNNSLTIKTYKMSDAKPKEPLLRELTLTSSRVAPDSMPEEVCVCLSFSAASPHTDRRRGRIYLGPFNNTCMTKDGTTSQCIISGGFQADIAVAAKRLANHVDAGWLIHSSVGVGSYAAVETGWIDNAFDTQRRRGPKGTSRYTWAKV